MVLFGERKQIDLNRGINELISKAGKVKTLSAYEAENVAKSRLDSLMRWEKLFNPNFVFNFFLKGE